MATVQQPISETTKRMRQFRYSLYLSLGWVEVKRTGAPGTVDRGIVMQRDGEYATINYRGEVIKHGRTEPEQRG